MTGTSKKQIQDIPLADIGEDALTRFSMDPPADTLAQSIRELGITHPVLLAPADRGYQIVCGHRRVECARLLKLKTVPALVLDTSPAPAEMLKRNSARKLVRRELTAISKKAGSSTSLRRQESRKRTSSKTTCLCSIFSEVKNCSSISANAPRFPKA